jgi:hypothetical protein
MYPFLLFSVTRNVVQECRRGDVGLVGFEEQKLKGKAMRCALDIGVGEAMRSSVVDDRVPEDHE